METHGAEASDPGDCPRCTRDLTNTTESAPGLEKVLEQLDLTGLSQKIIDDVATKTSGRGSVETLIETVLQREGQGLAERLEEFVLERLAYECEAGGQATVVPLVASARSLGSAPLT